MKVLFIGGTGIISTNVSKLAVKKGIDLYVLNRGNHNQDLPQEVTQLTGDIYDIEGMKKLLKGKYFDSVVQWISFTVEHVERDYNLFKEHTKQYVFISSASAYQKPLPFIPVTEEMPLDNPYWQYSKNKQLCEEYLLSVHSDDFNVTIIRPSHTYNEKMIVAQINSWQHPYTLVHRLQKNMPVIIPDQGMQLWTLTYSADFAHAFIDVLGNPKTYGEYYHLTGDKVYTWERIMELIAEAVGVTPHFVYIPWDFIFEHMPGLQPEILGDKHSSLTFDNSKIQAIAPHWRSNTDYGNIVKMAINHFEEHPELQTIDEQLMLQYDALIEAFNNRNN